MKKESVRVILNVPKDIDFEFSELAAKRGIAKSSMIIYSMSWFLDYNKNMNIVPTLSELLYFNPKLFSPDEENN